MRRKVLMIFMVSIALLYGCLDDQTNLGYNDVILPDTVIVTDVANQRKVYFDKGGVTFSITSGSELQLDVDVKYRGNDELTYEWRLGEKVISKEKNLRYVCVEEGELPALLLIYRKNAGNATVYPFNVKIRGPFDAGILVLGKHGGKTRLDFIERFVEQRTIEMGGSFYTASVHEYIDHPDVYPLYNDGEELASKPVQLLYCAGLQNAENKYSGVQVLDQDWKNSVLVNLKTMKKIVAMGDEFVGDPGNLKLKSMCDVGATSLLLDESGKIFSRVNYDDSNPGTGRFVSEPLGYNDPNDVPDKGTEELKADYITSGRLGSCDVAFIYEKDKKRILAMTAAETNSYQNIDYSMIHKLGSLFPMPNYVDLNNFDKELIGIFLPQNQISVSMGIVYVFYKDGHDYYLQVEMINASAFSTPHSVMCMHRLNTKLPNELGVLLEQNHGVFRIAKTDDYRSETLYVGVGNAIYSMVIQFMIPLLAPSCTLLHKFEEEGNITNLVFTETWESASGSVNRYAKGRVFAAGFDNGDLRVVKLYDDPMKPGEVQKKYWVQKNYDEGIVDMIYYNNSK